MDEEDKQGGHLCGVSLSLSQLAHFAEAIESLSSKTVVHFVYCTVVAVSGSDCQIR
jgi:hypothetical protein